MPRTAAGAEGAREAGERTVWLGAAYAVALGISAICFLWMRRAHELSFPVPWPDEGSFLWPALAFRDHSSLYSPELNPSREVYWMPPGFMVLEGTIFKIWSFSLGRARLLSALFLLGAVGSVAAMLKGSRVRLGHALVIAVFLFSPIFQMAGNTARMETLVLLVASAGFYLLHRRRWAGLAVLALGPLVHPNGLVFLTVGSVYWFAIVRDRRPFARADRISAGVVALFWGAYAVHVAPNFGAFCADMAGQLKFKSFVSAADGGAVSRLREPLLLMAFAAFVGGAVAARRFGARTGALSALCISALFASTLTLGWLYDIYPAFAAMLASLLALETAVAVVGEFPPPSSVKTAVTLGALVAFVVYVDAAWVASHPFLMRSVRSSTASNRSRETSYASTEEQYEVSEFLRKITPARRNVSVQFLPDSDSLLFESVRSPTLRYAQQTYFIPKPDVLVVHRSPWLPPKVFEVELMSLVLRNGVTVSLEGWQEIAHGPGDSRWLVLRKLPGKIDWR